MLTAYQTLRTLNLFLLAMLCGYFVSHSIVLGRFFQWFIDSGNYELLGRTYSVFREQGMPVAPYLAGFLLQFALAVVMALIAWRLRRNTGLALLLVLPLPAMLAVHFLSGYEAVEDVTHLGKATASQLAVYSSLNLTVHWLYALIYALPPLLFAFLDRHPQRASG
jgi:hypothetical protein